MTKKNRVLAIFLAAFVLLVILSSALCIEKKLNHECTGDISCPICQEILACESVLQNLSYAAVAIAIAFIAVSFSAAIVKYCLKVYPNTTLVSLKVKLLN